jgi:hypothetical protein
MEKKLSGRVPKAVHLAYKTLALPDLTTSERAAITVQLLIVEGLRERRRAKNEKEKANSGKPKLGAKDPARFRL